MSIPQRELFIGGRWVKPSRGGRLDVVSPFDASKIGTIPAGSADDVQVQYYAACSPAERHRRVGAFRKVAGHNKFRSAICARAGGLASCARGFPERSLEQFHWKLQSRVFESHRRQGKAP